MAKSLNPNAVENRDTDAPSASSLSPANSQPSANDERRNCLTKLAVGTIVLVLVLFPIAVSALTILDPLVVGTKKCDKFIRVTAVNQLPDDGTPIRVPIVADLVDAWDREPSQPIGAVYLRKEKDKVVALNAICQHTGCLVTYSAERRVFQCPCHAREFTVDGAPARDNNPSPCGMAPLNVDEDRLRKTGEVWVEFVTSMCPQQSCNNSVTLFVPAKTSHGVDSFTVRQA